MSNKISWRTILTGCFTTQSSCLEPEKSVIKRKSSKRLFFSDTTDPDTSLSLISDFSSSLTGWDLHIFTLAELKVITNNFSSSNFIGEGGFGPVHKGFVDDKVRPGLEAQPVAVKVLDLDGQQGHREWMTEVIMLGQLRHPHLVKLIGYCCEKENRLLVYEYMTRGNLENRLFGRFSVSLPWLTRLKIALGAAKGLAFLHNEEKPVIYRDFKASNILLDSDFTAKVSDFGLAKDGPEGDETHVSTRIMGTHGYAAPEYIMTGHLTLMSDVYSFGVVFLELLTGRRAMDKSRPGRDVSLVEWARPLLKEAQRLDRILDPKLEAQYSIEGAKRACILAYKCLSHRPQYRPTMTDVVNTLETLLEFNDIPIGPFVYVVPKEGEKGYNNEDSENSMEKKENIRHTQRRGYRHKHRISSLRDREIYSDTALYDTSRSAFYSSKH